MLQAQAPKKLEITLARTPAAPGRARTAARAFLADLGVPEDAVTRALLVVSELVTNGVLHGADGPLTLTLAREGESVRVAVADAGQGFSPSAWPPPPGAVGGHGLHIVGRVARRWGIAAEASRVWAELHLDPGSPHQAFAE